MIKEATVCYTAFPWTTPSTSGAGSAQSDALAGESFRRHTLDQKKLTNFFHEYSAGWEEIGRALGLKTDLDEIEQEYRCVEDRMKAVIKLVWRQKDADGKTLSLDDIRQALQALPHTWKKNVKPLQEFEQLIKLNPNHFYCKSTRRPETPGQEIKSLKRKLEHSQDKNKKMRQEIYNFNRFLNTTKQQYQTQITILWSELKQMRAQLEREKGEKQEKEVLLQHVNQRPQQFQTSPLKQQQTRDSVSDAASSVESHRESQGGSVVPAAAKLPRAASDKPCVPVARVAPWKVEVTPQTYAVTMSPALRDAEVNIWTLTCDPIECRLRFYWSELINAFNLTRSEFSGGLSREIPDEEYEAITRDHTGIGKKYRVALEKMLACKNMTYGDFERVLRNLPIFTQDVNFNKVNEVIKELNRIGVVCYKW